MQPVKAPAKENPHLHGLIHAQLEEFVETRYGADAWKTILSEAGLGDKTYLRNVTYADHEAAAIISAASKLTNKPADDLLESFGEFLAPTLIATYRQLIQPSWKTMDLLLHTEETVHKVVRLRDSGPQPSRLDFQRIGPNVLKFDYNSPRRMSALARGIIKGVAKHYGETVTIEVNSIRNGRSEMTITIR